MSDEWYHARRQAEDNARRFEEWCAKTMGMEPAAFQLKYVTDAAFHALADVYKATLAEKEREVEGLTRQIETWRQIFIDIPYPGQKTVLRLERCEAVIEVARKANRAYCFAWRTMYPEMEELRSALIEFDAQNNHEDSR